MQAAMLGCPLPGWLADWLAGMDLDPDLATDSPPPSLVDQRVRNWCICA
jgi:hypothetical protein